MIVPFAVHVDDIVWESEGDDGTKSGTLTGSRDAGVQFTYAFFIPAGFWDAPHSHMADAHVFVMSGELRLGYGSVLDTAAARPFAAGSYLHVPAGEVHFDGAEVDTIILGAAVGPWSTDYHAARTAVDHARWSRLDGLGTVSIRSIDGDHPRPPSSSPYDDWGPMAPEAKGMAMDRWLVEVAADDGSTVAVGDMSAHAVWYGPTPGSRAMNIGISLVEDYRGRGIGAVAQRLLAEHLHANGVVRVEASTDVENIAEQRALARAGFAYEGTALRAQQRADGLHDLQVWSHVAG